MNYKCRHYIRHEDGIRSQGLYPDAWIFHSRSSSPGYSVSDISCSYSCSPSYSFLLLPQPFFKYNILHSFLLRSLPISEALEPYRSPMPCIKCMSPISYPSTGRLPAASVRFHFKSVRCPGPYLTSAQYRLSPNRLFVPHNWLFCSFRSFSKSSFHQNNHYGAPTSYMPE